MIVNAEMLSKMTKKEEIEYLQSLPLNEEENESIEPIYIEGDVHEWARAQGCSLLDEALERLSNIGNI